jgi:ferric-dicitrate binding protein FerR (iron transport regulator)
MEFDPTILKKYLDGKFSLNDKKVVDEYFLDDQFTQLLDLELKKYWKDIYSLDPVLDKINRRIHLQSQKNPAYLRYLWQLYGKVAAILLLPVLIFSVYFMMKRGDGTISTASLVEVYSPYGSRTKFLLPDGSVGWLNGGSSVQYPVSFGQERRVVLNGEAFFEVVKNPQSPFIVDGNSLQIKVLGTSFNVVSYDQDSISEVVVATGKVEVSGEGQKQVLSPSERLISNRLTNKVTRSNVDAENYISWRTGELKFLNDNLDEVVRKLSRYYYADIEVGQDVDKKQQFRAIMQNESLEEILKYMKLTMDIDFIIQERAAGNDNIVSKRKIIITSIKK